MYIHLDLRSRQLQSSISHKFLQRKHAYLQCYMLTENMNTYTQIVTYILLNPPIPSLKKLFQLTSAIPVTVTISSEKNKSK